MIFEEMERKLPEQFKGKHNISVLLEAIADELEELRAVLQGMLEKTSFSAAEGVNLDGIGDIVVLSREDARRLLSGASDLLTDDYYRNMLRYKAAKNTSICTSEEIISLYKTLYASGRVRYWESPLHPAHFSLMVETDMDLADIEQMANFDMAVKPGGVSMTLSFIEAGGDFFGFIDLNADAKGFGLGKFALSIV